MASFSRTALSLFTGLLSLPICYLFAAMLLSLIPSTGKEYPCTQPDTAWVSTNGVHLSLILPVELVSDEILHGLDSDKPASYLSFGWGDSTFYVNTPTWGDLRPGVAFKAMLCPTPSAMHLYFIDEIFDNSHPVSLCPAQIDALNAYIFNSFEKNTGGLFIEMEGAAYGDDDIFYRGRGRYNLFYTSNNWANQALKEIGAPASLWSPFDKGTIWQLKN